MQLSIKGIFISGFISVVLMTAGCGGSEDFQGFQDSGISADTSATDEESEDSDYINPEPYIADTIGGSHHTGADYAGLKVSEPDCDSDRCLYHASTTQFSLYVFDFDDDPEDDTDYDGAGSQIIYEDQISLTCEEGQTTSSDLVWVSCDTGNEYFIAFCEEGLVSSFKLDENEELVVTPFGYSKVYFLCDAGGMFYRDTTYYLAPTTTGSSISTSSGYSSGTYCDNYSSGVVCGNSSSSCISSGGYSKCFY